MTIRVGIFWVINGKIIRFIENRGTDDLSKREQATGKTDSGFEHFSTWDKELANKYPDADFATYPRGRVMFDIKENRHIVYADKCVTKENTEEIVKLFDISEYAVERDEHYRCDKCMKHKEPPELRVEDCGDSYRVWLTTSYGVIKRTLDKSECDEFAFEDILAETEVKENNGKLTCKFFVEEVPPSSFGVFFARNTGIMPLYTVRNRIYYKILDGKDRIGANLIELSCNNKVYLIECGTELEPTENGTQLRKKTLRKRYDACFITHYHGDHAGLLCEPLNCEKIYMGKYTLKILQAIGGICEENGDKVITFNANEEMCIDGLSVTPYNCDHSAYDSYMLYFKSEKNSLLYTGDFRSHGRKNYSALLKKLPEKVDTLICEGTNIGVGKASLSERDLENKLVDICKNDKPVFVLQSATNIDRIVSVYRAAVRSNRLFIMRLLQADICAELPNIPQPNGFKMCFAYSEFPMSDEKYKHYSEKYGMRLIGREGISKIKKYVLEITSKDLLYLQNLAEICDLKGAKLIYSTWSGYKDRDDMKEFLDGVKKLGIEIIDLHASGHADGKAIDALKEKVNPDKFIQIHRPQEN